MYARRFLGCIVVLTLLFVAGAFAFYQWGGRVLVQQSVPKGHFEQAQAGDGPDYTQSSSWIARPGMAGDPADWLPDGQAPESSGKVAVFYVHPTTYLDRDRWNAPLDVGGETEYRTRLFVQSQASAFNRVGEIWAPRYRQAAYGAFLLKSEDAEKALDLAYGDVAAAFDQFVREAGDRPIILAAHSQGALHLERLLKEKVAGKPIAERIVAAYVVGWPISTIRPGSSRPTRLCVARGDGVHPVMDDLRRPAQSGFHLRPVAEDPRLRRRRAPAGRHFVRQSDQRRKGWVRRPAR